MTEDTPTTASLTAIVRGCSTERLLWVLDSDDERWADTLRRQAEYTSPAEGTQPFGVSMSTPDGAWVLQRTVRYLPSDHLPLPGAVRQAHLAELTERARLTHAAERAEDVAMAEPVEVMSYRTGEYEPRCWEYLERRRLPAFLLPLEDTDRPHPHRPPLASPPALWRPRRVRVRGEDLPRAVVRHRLRKRAALLAVLRR